MTSTTEQDVPPKVLRLAVGHRFLHCSLPAVTVVTYTLQGHQELDSQRCRVKNHELTKAFDLAPELCHDTSTPPFLQCIAALCLKDFLTGFGTCLPVLGHSNLSKSNSTYQSIIDVRSMLDTSRIKLLMQGV